MLSKALKFKYPHLEGQSYWKKLEYENQFKFYRSKYRKINHISISKKKFTKGEKLPLFRAFDLLNIDDIYAFGVMQIVFLYDKSS